MLRVATWCAKCLFLYFLVAAAAIRYSWVFTTPVWRVAGRMQWTHLSQVAFVLSYFLPIFAIAGFLIGLVPFGHLAKAIGDLRRSLSPSAETQLPPEPDPAPAILWAWVPVTLAFLIRFLTWRSRNTSVFAVQQSTGRVERFFGVLHAQNPGLLDDRWIMDRFLFTGPMLFLMTCALAVFLRHKFTRTGLPAGPTSLSHPTR